MDGDLSAAGAKATPVRETQEELRTEARGHGLIRLWFSDF